MGFIWSIIIGIVAGYLAGKIMRGGGFGVIVKVFVGRVIIHRADIAAAGFLAVILYIRHFYSCRFAEHLRGIICAERHPVVVRP